MHIYRAARCTMEFQLFLFKTRICGHSQKPSLAKPQRQLKWHSAYICRKGRLVLTARGPDPNLSLLKEPSAS